MKRSLILIALTLLSISAFSQSSKVKARTAAIREKCTQTNNEINRLVNGEDAAVFWPMNATVLKNESAVGVVKYVYNYYPMSHIDCWDMLRLKRTVTVFPADVYEIYYENGKPAFYFEKERSYQEEGHHVETRVYWYADGTLCNITSVNVDSKGNQTPVKLSEERKKEIENQASHSANLWLQRCTGMYGEEHEEEYE